MNSGAQNKSPAANAGAAGRFRLSLLVAMMICISGVTGIVLFIAERNAQATAQEALEQKFQSKIAYERGLEDGRQTAVEERCRLLARSVRIRAALQEDDLQDLYDNAYAEMPDVFEAATHQGRPSALRANSVRFLNAAGQVLSPRASDPGIGLEPWEKALTPFAGVSSDQAKGYVAIPGKGIAPALNEAICTPVIDADNGLHLGSMVLFFTPAEFDPTNADDIQGGIVTGNEFYGAPGSGVANRQAMAAAVLAGMGDFTGETGNFQTAISGSPSMVFYRLLNPGSPLPKAWQVCLYPLADSLAKLVILRDRILASGCAILLLGLIASHFLSRRLAQPVEAIAADSAANQAGRAEAEAALVLTEQKYRGIFENAVEGIFLLSPEGRFQSVNPAMAAIFGFESPDALLAHWKTAAVGAYADPARHSEFLACVSQEGTAAHWEMEMIRRDGRRIWVSQSARAVKRPDGGLMHIEGTMLDVTQRKRAADELQTVNMELEKTLETLQATEQQVIQQERLRALGQMASGIAHDFNNALMPISGFSEMLVSQPKLLDDRDTALQYLGMIHTAACDAGSVVGRLREFYRPNEQTDIFGAVMLNRVAKQASTLTRPKWKDQAQANGAEIAVRLQLEDRTAVNADESALRELLTNLIFNAVDAMPQGGTLAIRTYCEPECGVLEISDTGTGMSDETRKRCLEPFYSTKGDRGTGLGLAMVFGIVQRHQGSIDITSQLGQGTRFTIRLPLHRETLLGADAGAVIISSHRLQILLVDDEPQVREVLAALLNAEGHVCETASHALEAIHRFQEHHFDIVIADKAMPGMSGDQMAVSIKKIAPAVPFVLLTGFGSFLDSGPIPGVDVVASKPITRSGLREAIGKAFQAAA